MVIDSFLYLFPVYYVLFVSFLKELKKLCQKFDLPLVYNETASQMYRYSEDHYFLSNVSELRPDCGLAYMS